MSSNDIHYNVSRIRELRREVEELEAMISTLQDEIKAEMTAQGVNEMSGLDFKVSWKEVVTSRFNSKAFKVAHADLYQAFTVPTKTKRFLIA